MRLNILKLIHLIFYCCIRLGYTTLPKVPTRWKLPCHHETWYFSHQLLFAVVQFYKMLEKFLTNIFR